MAALAVCDCGQYAPLQVTLLISHPTVGPQTDRPWKMDRIRIRIPGPMLTRGCR